MSLNLDDLVKNLCAILPDGIKSVEEKMAAEFKSILQAAFNRLDLVTREEFDVQVKVLARTREKLEQLQEKLKAFEKKTA